MPENQRRRSTRPDGRARLVPTSWLNVEDIDAATPEFLGVPPLVLDVFVWYLHQAGPAPCLLCGAPLTFAAIGSRPGALIPAFTCPTADCHGAVRDDFPPPWATVFDLYRRAHPGS
ncbi:unnamed protein product [marine sediment metagenome]|uniref:Uncharacterized protein n=1 Tax=marine sediment metagenome TaxID=412755 RepID=X1SMM3_9ZZZZ